MNSFNLKIVTLDGIKFDQEINSLETTTTKGRIGIFANHVNIIGQLVPNKINVWLKSGSKEQFVITGGYLFFEKNNAKIIAHDFYDLKTNTINDVESSINNLKSESSKLDQNSLNYKMLSKKIKDQEMVLSIIKKNN